MHNDTRFSPHHKHKSHCKHYLLITYTTTFYPLDWEKTPFFDIHLRKDATLRESQEYYVRSGITISDIKSLGNRPVRALFVAEDPVITAFLGDAETPAHTTWNEGTEGFKAKYENASKALRFIKRSMAIIVSLLDLPPKEKQIDLLKDIFSILEPVNEDSEDPVLKRNMPIVKGRPPRFNIAKLQDGLRISLAEKKIRLPLRTRVRLAYDVRRGNPFRQYEKEDFDLSTGSISIRPIGCSVIRASANVLDFEVTNPDFSLEVVRFDAKRDLIAEVKEVSDETEA